MPYDQIAILALFLCAYSAVAGGTERTVFNGALVFVGFGVLIGPLGFGWFDGDATAPGLRLVAELTLALVLFVEAAKTDLSVLRRAYALPQRLILISLPLVIALGFLFGLILLPDLSLIGLALLATILAPTDAALGKAVVTNKAVPSEIREGLNFESGLNDGVCVPIFLAFLAVATGREQAEEVHSIAFKLIVQEIGVGALVGLAIAALAAGILQIAYKRNWISHSWVQLPIVAAAIACFCAAQALHGSGFIAAFVGGLLFGYLAGDSTDELVHAAEGIGDAFALATWVFFGSSMIWVLLPYFTWQTVLYAVLSLTATRMVPVVLGLRGLPLTMPQKLFVGWFGPRGLATVVFAMMIAQSDIPETNTIIAVATCAVIFSVIGHTLSAHPIIRVMFGPPSEEAEANH